MNKLKYQIVEGFPHKGKVKASLYASISELLEDVTVGDDCMWWVGDMFYMLAKNIRNERTIWVYWEEE